MRKLLIILVSFCAFALYSCQEKQKTYTYVEPEENIAKKVWKLLTEGHPEVEPVILEAIDFDYYSQEECTESKSKTELYYDYFVPQGSEEEDSFLVAQYHLKCFQRLDGSWIGLVIKYVHGYGLNEKDCGRELFAVHYDGTKVAPYDLHQVLPQTFAFMEDYYTHSYDKCFYFSDDALFFSNAEYWPIELKWNGNNLEKSSESVILASAVQMAFGDFIYMDKGQYNTIQIGDPCNQKDGIFTDSQGNALAHFDVKDGLIEGYTLVSPLCGVVQSFDYDSDFGVSRITSKPIALGYPIQNVLDYNKGYNIKDTVVSQGMKDGRYFITQQIAHDKLYKKRDIFIDYTAKDEHSAIEEIRVYSYPLSLTLDNEVNESEELTPEVKTIFNALQYDFKAPEFGEFDRFLCLYNDHNGFNIDFKGEVRSVRFQTYPAGDQHLVIIAKYGEDEKLRDFSSWYYANDNFTEALLDLPIPAPVDFEAYSRNDDYDISQENYILTFNDAGIEYYALSERNDGASTKDENGIYINPDFYTIQYRWNGETFE
ncbi:MAG: hypothetical protein J6W26_01545 [Bacteroidales bacterium]|nr:hypothetical protein [Bacteroidales bacterium]